MVQILKIDRAQLRRELAELAPIPGKVYGGDLSFEVEDYRPALVIASGRVVYRIYMDTIEKIVVL